MQKYKIFDRIFVLVFIGISLAMIFLSIPSNLKIGMIQFNDHEYDKAYLRLIQVTEKNQNNVFALKKMKDYFLLNNNLSAAVAVQEKLVDLRPKNIEYVRELEKLYSWSNMPAKKLKLGEYLLELLPEEDRKAFALQLAEEFRWLKDNSRAQQLYEQFAGKMNEAEQDRLLQFYLATGKQEQALALLNKKKQIGKVTLRERRLLAETYFASNQYLNALQEYVYLLTKRELKGVDVVGGSFIQALDAVKIRENSQTIEMIHVLLEKLDLRETRQKLMRHIANVSGNYYQSLQFVQVLLEQKNKKEARMLLLKMRALHTDKIGEIADYFEAMDFVQDAIDCYQLMLRKQPNNKPLLRKLASLYESTGQLNKAEKIYQRLLR